MKNSNYSGFIISLKHQLNVDERREINVVISQVKNPANSIEFPVEGNSVKEALVSAKEILEKLVDTINQELKD